MDTPTIGTIIVALIALFGIVIGRLGLPQITHSSQSQITYEGKRVDFIAHAHGWPCLTIHWEVNRSNGTGFTRIQDQDSPTYTFTATRGQDGNYYRAVFKTWFGIVRVHTLPALLTVQSAPLPKAAPSVTQHPNNQGAAVGQSVSFRACATGNPAPTVQWQVMAPGARFSNLPGATDAIYTSTAAVGESGNQYRAVFTNAHGTDETIPATLTVEIGLVKPACSGWGLDFGSPQGCQGMRINCQLCDVPKTVAEISVGTGHDAWGSTLGPVDPGRVREHLTWHREGGPGGSHPERQNHRTFVRGLIYTPPNSYSLPPEMNPNGGAVSLTAEASAPAGATNAQVIVRGDGVEDSATLRVSVQSKKSKSKRVESMTPDKIYEFLAAEFPELVAESRSNPDGWAFYAGLKQRGPKSNRILRATRSSQQATTKLKLAVSSRDGQERELDFSGDEEQLRLLVEEELRLYERQSERE